ncbi:hypothetical protein BSSX_0845 [Bacillus subtilis]|nr:hypothetical protein BSSX_0845 [Bacillus subtilis]
MEPLFHHSTSRPFYLDHIIFIGNFLIFQNPFSCEGVKIKKRQTASAFFFLPYS